MTPAEKQKAYRARQKAESANPRIDFSGQHGKHVVIDKMVAAGPTYAPQLSTPEADPKRGNVKAWSSPATDRGELVTGGERPAQIDRETLLKLVEELYEARSSNTTWRIRLRAAVDLWP